jgi:hypothetical protein
VYLRRIEKSTVMNSIKLFSYLSTPFHSYSENASSMLTVRFESGKKGGIVEKLFPFLAIGSKE